MKKIMVAAAIVCAAAMAHAAAFNWSDEGVMDAAGKNLYSGALTVDAYLKGTTDVVASFNGTMTGGAFSFEDASAALEAGSTYTFVYTMTDAAGNVYTSESKNKKAQESSTADVAFAAGGTWTTTPEPTSALLLLLGVAGLALKRKQA